MSNHDFFPDDGAIDVTDSEKAELFKKWDEEDQEHICPSCRFKLAVHSTKQILSCALKEIRLVLGVEKV